MRRGIQICYLQFGDCGSLDQHGFARNKIWLIDENPPPLASNESFGKSFVDLLLKSSEEDLKQWPHSFKFHLRVSLAIDGDLTLVSRVRNINGKPFSFSFLAQSRDFCHDNILLPSLESQTHNFRRVMDFFNPRWVMEMSSNRETTTVVREDLEPNEMKLEIVKKILQIFLIA
ncbi:hypothetical protein HID58_020405 [Brassica napus]|uniref:Uncharacterized protein n=1 Tax=Brassica napus TaxID=3708 RepID=A0ABQ7XH21_BRANA|nr:hypothetical protein HID58_020405 [Brassica napus]